MSIEKKIIKLTVEWPAIRQAATAAHGTKLNMQALEQKHGFNAANAEEACHDDTVFEEWLAWRDKAEIENLRFCNGASYIKEKQSNKNKALKILFFALALD